jgi:HEPN domain-containing protein
VDNRNKDKALAWIKYAINDLSVATHLNETYHPLPENTICWHCQQSVEKSLKSILVYNDVKVPKTHDIRMLLQTTVQYEPSITLDEKVADRITAFAVESRYPDNALDITKEDAELGLKYAKRVLDQVKQALNITDKEPPPKKQTTE